MSQTLYGFKAKTMQGQEATLEDYKGKVILIVNTASKCGFTPQFKGLEELKNASIDRLCKVPGINKETAKEIYYFFLGNHKNHEYYQL